MGKTNIATQLDSTYRINIKNIKSKKNRYVVSKIIDYIQFTGGFEQFTGAFIYLFILTNVFLYHKSQEPPLIKYIDYKFDLWLQGQHAN